MEVKIQSQKTFIALSMALTTDSREMECMEMASISPITVVTVTLTLIIAMKPLMGIINE